MNWNSLFVGKKEVWFEEKKIEAILRKMLGIQDFEVQEYFSKLLNDIGVKTPVNIYWGTRRNVSDLECATKKGEKIKIQFCPKEELKPFPTVCVTHDNETREYAIVKGREPGQDIPEVALKSKTIKGDGRNLVFRLDREWTLELPEGYSLKVYIQSEDPKKDTQTSTEIEEYLLKLDNPLDVLQIYKDVIQLFNFSEEDIKSSNEILIHYLKNDDVVGRKVITKRVKTLAKVLIINGEMQEYAVTEDGETFHVFRNGMWKYSSKNMEITYLVKHDVKITDETINSIDSIDLLEVSKRINRRIAEMQEFVK